MNEEKADRIRELTQRINHWDAEQTHDIQQKRDTNEGLKDTLALTMYVAVWGSIPSVIWIAWCVSSSVSSLHNDVPVFDRVFSACGALLLFGIILAGGARAGGLAAHWWFWNSIINRRTAAIVIALTVDAILFGWVLFLF